jgi:hypothetical protein
LMSDWLAAELMKVLQGRYNALRTGTVRVPVTRME